MPNDEPKSGCACVADPIVATQADDFALTGNVDTSACQTLSAGKIEHFFDAALVEGDGDGDGDGNVDVGTEDGGPDAVEEDGSAVAADFPAEHDDSTTTTVKPTRTRCFPQILRLEGLTGTRVVHRDRPDRAGHRRIEQDLVGVNLGGDGARSTVFTP